MTEIAGERIILRNIVKSDFLPLWQTIYAEDSPEWKKWDAPYYPLDGMGVNHGHQVAGTGKDSTANVVPELVD